MNTGWKRVIYGADCDREGNCPVCLIDFAGCGCPGPTQDDEYEYEVFGGHLMARRLEAPREEGDE